MSAVPAEVAAAPPVDNRRRYILIATIIGSSMAFVDGSVVNIALPTIGRDLHANLAAQQWVMLGYSLSVSSLYIVSGALGDRYGRWTLFTVGVAAFAASSALAGLAPNTELLITARLLQGVAGALLTTNSLALLRATYGAESGNAVGQWTAWSGIGTMIGPPLGGLLVEYASWRWIFFINLPFAVLAVAMAFLGRSDERLPEHPRPVQWGGATALAVTFGSLTFALIEGANRGFATVWWAALLSLAGLGLLVTLERRSAESAPAPRTAALTRVRGRQRLHAAGLRGARRRDLLPGPVPAVGRGGILARPRVADLPAHQHRHVLPRGAVRPGRRPKRPAPLPDDRAAGDVGWGSCCSRSSPA